MFYATLMTDDIPSSMRWLHENRGQLFVDAARNMLASLLYLVCFQCTRYKSRTMYRCKVSHNSNQLAYQAQYQHVF